MLSLPSLSDSTTRANHRVREFRGFFRIVLGVEGLMGLGLLILPGLVHGLFGLPDAPGWLRLLGLFLLWAVLFQVPGLLNPVHARLPVVIGVLGRYALGLALLIAGAWLGALLVLTAALVLNVLYHKLVRAVLMSRP